MQQCSWSVFDTWTVEELEHRLMECERWAGDAFRAGNYDVGHDYYLKCCEIGMALALREGQVRAHTAESK